MLGIIEFLPVVVSLWCLHCLQSIKVEVKLGFPRGSVGKESACSAGDLGSIPVLGRWRNGNSLQYSCLENSRQEGA